jgi:hypothetical protein
MTKDSLKEGRSAWANNAAPANIARLLVLFLCQLACFCAAWNSGLEGLAQFRAGYGLMTERLEDADQAVGLNPATPEAHYARASLLYDKGELAEAVKEYEAATALRPRDYALWLELGRAREQSGDAFGALTAFKESARLAPFYAQPRWQLGNTLYRLGRRDEAFKELQLAVASDPKLTPPILDLLWASFGDDTQAVERVIQPQTPSAHLALARFFLRHGKTSEGLAQFRAAGDLVPAEERRALLTELLAAHRFNEAYEVWSAGRVSNDKKLSSVNGSLINGGFEDDISLNEPGFGWQLPQGMQGVQAAQDTAAPRAGERSLQLAWNGNNTVEAPYLSQLILVQPDSRYELRFAARTEKVVTGGLPLLMLTDANGQDARTLGRPVMLPQGTSDWQDYSIEFVTGKETTAALLSVRRQTCSSTPCPIFGRAWLDDFSLRKINGKES